jgi:hypothetical protein
MRPAWWRAAGGRAYVRSGSVPLQGAEVERDDHEEREPCARDEREEEQGQSRLREARNEGLEGLNVARRELYVLCGGHAVIVRRTELCGNRAGSGLASGFSRV